MKLKSLLFMVTLLLCCLGVRAQSKVVFEEHFVAEPTDPSAVGFYEFINTEEGDTHSIENGVLSIFNSDGTLDEGSWWRRAIKFRNLDLQEGKIYRLDFKLRGSNRYEDGTHEGDARPRCQASAQLLQGEDDYDISLLDYSGNEQRATFERFNESEYESYASTFVFASEALQKEKYAEKGKGELADKFFLSLNVYNPGMFDLKDVVLTEVSTVQSAEFGDFAIKVNFGNNTNIADMALADEKGLVFFGNDLGYASVKCGNEVMTIESIEYHADGCLYIFTEDELAAEGGVVVSFTNPTDEKQIKFKGSVESPASIFDFEGQEATFNEALVGELSYLYQAPALKASNPKDDSFAIDEKLSEFSFTFDRKVSTARAKAILNCDGVETDLALKEGQGEYVETIVFVRKDNGLLAKKNSITLSSIFSEQEIEKTEGYVINFEAGMPKIAQEIYTPTQTIDFSNDVVGTIPLGWTLVNDMVDGEGEVRPSGTSGYSGGPRLLFPGGFYVRTNKANAISTATFGNLEGYAVTLPVGDLRIQFVASGYKAAGQRVLCEVLDATGENVLASTEHNMVEITPDGGPASTDEKITVAYKNEKEQNAIIRYTVYQGSGMTETMLNSVIVNTYEKTEGDVPDDKVIMTETFSKWDNVTPTAGSGWNMYDAGSLLSKGEGGYRSRVISTKGKGMAKAYLCRSYGDNYYATYGEEAEGPKLTLEKGIEYEITYHAAIWNAQSAQVEFAVLAPEGMTLGQRTDDLTADAKDGTAESFEPNKFTYKFTPSATGDYILKFGSHTLIVCGNISVVQPGSRAVKYYSLLAETVDAAKATLAKAEDPMYDGATKTALSEAIAKYEDPSKITMTTEEEFNAAITELILLSKSMETRIEYIPRFKKAVTDAKTLIDEGASTKYAKLDCYDGLVDVYNTYAEVNPETLEDAELIASTTELEDNSTLFKNMKDVCVGLLTKQINALADQLIDLDIDMTDDPYVAAAREALTDDQEIAYQLKLRITRAIYEMCAESDPFNTPEMDPETGELVPGEFIPVEIDGTNFIQNANFYSTGGVSAKVTDFPGWTINVIQGSIGATWGTAGWCGEPATPLKPVVDAAIKTGWGTHEHDAQQLIDVLPVVKYNASIIVGEDGGETHDAYAYLGEGEDQVKVVYDGEKPGEEGNTYSRDTNLPRVFSDVAAKTTEEEWFLGSILLGAHPVVHGGFTRTDNAKLTMIGKVEGFNYLEAAAKITELINSQTKKGDVNGDGIVNGTDIQAVINFIVAGEFNEKADVNKDGIVNGTDIQEIINIIVGN